MEKFQIEADVTPQFTKDETLNLRFPCKLWILINSPNSAASWGRNGRTVLLDYIALDRYLSSTLSIFRTETIFSFIRQLSCYGFQKVADGGASEVPPHGIFFEFENSNFVQQREDLLANVVVTSSQKKQLPKILQHSRTLRAQEDPCSSAIRALSAIEKARLNLRVILQMQAENYTLSKKLSNCEENSPSSAVSVIELPADAFENPFDSISRFEENSEYAGYYGNASTEQITQFFDEYLPIYAQANGDEITEKPASAQSSFKEPPKQTTSSSSFSYFVPGNRSEHSTNDDSAANPSSFQVKYSDNKEYTLNILEVDGATTTVTECNDGMDNSREEDISMDQYLKFRNSPQKSDGNGLYARRNADGVEIEAFDQNGLAETCNGQAMDRRNIGDCDDANENNFKLFFNQYRESINLLYDAV